MDTKYPCILVYQKISSSDLGRICFRLMKMGNTEENIEEENEEDNENDGS